jgi:hypothetical protein
VGARRRVACVLMGERLEAGSVVRRHRKIMADPLRIA